MSDPTQTGAQPAVLRQGYSTSFLGVEIPLPRMPPELTADLVTWEDGTTATAIFPYTHFSLVLSRSRRLARFTAVNIDGEQKVALGPRGRDVWTFDPRVPVDSQLGETLYTDSPFDHGHLVRRLDPVWGASRDEAEQADGDTFHYSNCSPQCHVFNESKQWWAGLEDYILTNADHMRLRVCVFDGPVFATADPVFRNIQIPREFWKVVVTRASDRGLSATGYLLSQSDMLDTPAALDRAGEAAFAFGQFRTFQVSVAEIERKTGLSFGDLSQHDPLRQAVPRATRLELTSAPEVHPILN
jgi:endonuclease G, mitochondrial